MYTHTAFTHAHAYLHVECECSFHGYMHPCLHGFCGTCASCVHIHVHVHARKLTIFQGAGTKQQRPRLSDGYKRHVNKLVRCLLVCVCVCMCVCVCCAPGLSAAAKLKFPCNCNCNCTSVEPLSLIMGIITFKRMIWYMRTHACSTNMLTHTHACMHAVARESVAQDTHPQQCMYMCAFCMYLCYSKKMCDRLCAHLCMHICSKHVLCLLLFLIKVVCF